MSAHSAFRRMGARSAQSETRHHQPPRCPRRQRTPIGYPDGSVVPPGSSTKWTPLSPRVTASPPMILAQFAACWAHSRVTDLYRSVCLCGLRPSAERLDPETCAGRAAEPSHRWAVGGSAQPPLLPPGRQACARAVLGSPSSTALSAWRARGRCRSMRSSGSVEEAMRQKPVLRCPELGADRDRRRRVATPWPATKRCSSGRSRRWTDPGPPVSQGSRSSIGTQ